MSRDVVAVEIKLRDTKLERLGMDQDEDELTWLYFKPSALQGFWIDPDDKDLKFYACGDSFITPFSRHTEELFMNILKENL